MRISLSRSQEHRPFWVGICQIWNRCYCLQEAGRRGGAGVGCSEQLNTVSSAATHQYRGLTVWPDTHGHTGTRDSYDQEDPCVKIVKRGTFPRPIDIFVSGIILIKISKGQQIEAWLVSTRLERIYVCVCDKMYSSLTICLHLAVIWTVKISITSHLWLLLQHWRCRQYFAIIFTIF